ncbi:MAG: PD40 domain-containing protein [Chloroflexi bacterium]|nr:PD40 domain-containing protein [Chloroflexota bacterium]
MNYTTTADTSFETFLPFLRYGYNPRVQKIISHRLSLLALLLFLLSFFPIQPALAHPADLYAHTITVELTQTDMRVEWQVKPGLLLVNFIWNEMDVDQDGSVSEEEGRNWSASRLDQLTVTVDGKSLPLAVDSINIPSSLQAFQAGEEFLVYELSAGLSQNTNNTQRIVIENDWDSSKAINWFYLTAEDGTAFLFPSQKSHILTIDFIHNPAGIEDQSRLLTSWDSGAPALPFGQEKDVVTETAEQVVPELSERSPQEILLDLVRSKEGSLAFYAFALVIALALGALHALTPGHGKTVVAAYLVGSRGTSWHAIVLGTVVTLTHTGSVFLLGILTLAASQYILPTTVIPFLEILSGALILGLGLYLLWQRFIFWRSRSAQGGGKNNIKRVSLAPKANVHKPAGSVKVDSMPAGMHHHGDGKMHSHDVPEAITWRSLIALGVSGGLVPCPDAIAILLVAIAINRLMLGLALILSFSLGLAVVLIVIGLLMVNSRRLFDRMGFLDRFAPVMPLVSAIVVVILGAALTWGAVVRAKENAGFAAPVQTSVNEARILYLREDENRIKGLFITDFSSDTSQLISGENQSVDDTIVSPDFSQAAYVTQNESTSNEIWLLDLENLSGRKLTDCRDAICSGLVWSPNGSRIIYEHMSLDGNTSGLPTLWWVDVATAEAQPVFQDSQLPGGNPRWSPDGKWLSYATPEGIRLYHLESGETRMIENVLGAAAVWSPNSKTILLRDVVIRHDQFVTELFIYGVESQTLVNISLDKGFENTFAVWSPDGETIAVVRRDLSVTRGDQVWLMNPDGSDPRMVTNDVDALHGSLNWSPDGNYILFELYALDNFPFSSKLQVVDAESGELKDLRIDGFNPKWVW